MKNLYVVLYLTLLFFSISKAQNLVPNGSFEQYSSCPTAQNQLDRATPWMNPSTGSPIATTGSPDYFHQCNSSGLGVPQNVCGNQAARTGVAYAGVHLWSGGPNPDSVREYLEVPLTTTLTAGNCYHFEMYFSLADGYKYTASTIAAYFSDTVIAGVPNFFPLPFTPQITNATGNFPDATNWKLVSGDLTAEGGERYLLIGSFVDDASTDTVMINAAAPVFATYVFIDDVSLVPTMPCNPTGLNAAQSAQIEVFPNPATERLQISTGSEGDAEVTILDIQGRAIFRQSFSSLTTLDITDLPQGIYLYAVRLENGMMKQGKFLKE